jgi:Skp family chaperone for outer membrane proteins
MSRAALRLLPFGLVFVVFACSSSPAPTPKATDSARVGGGAPVLGPTCSVDLAIVDVDAVVEESDDGAEITRTTRRRYEELQAMLQKKEADLRAEADEIEKLSKVLSPDALRKRGEDYQRHVLAYQELVVRGNEELKSLEKTLWEESRGRVREYVRSIGPELAAKYGLVAIFAKREALWARPGVDAKSDQLKGRPRLDVTDAVIERYREHAKKNRGESI